MWSYVKMPAVPGVGVTCLERFCVSQDGVIEAGEVIAVAHTDHITFDIVSNYRGRLLKILHPFEVAMVRFRDPIATIELLEDPPIDAPPIESWRERASV